MPYIGQQPDTVVTLSGPGSVPLAAIIPIGVTADSGDIVNHHVIPSTGVVDSDGYQLCDGAAMGTGATLTGNTPSLDDGRFLRGNTEANCSSTRTGGADSTDLSSAHIPQHAHTGPSHSHSAGSHTHAVNAQTHSHNFNANSGGHSHGRNTGNQYIFVGSGSQGLHNSPPTACNSSSNTGSGSGSFNANTNDGGTTSNADASNGNTGAGGTGDTGNYGSASVTGVPTVPKYLQVVYLMRVK